MDPHERRRILLELYQHALTAVDGRRVVADYLRQRTPAGPVAVAAVGKAASAMAAGALDALGDRVHSTLVVTKHGHYDPTLRRRGIACIEAGHPVPDPASLAAGARLLAFIDALPPELPLIFLISGGASAVAEVLPEGVGLGDLQRATDWLLGAGHDIGAVNRVRKRLSLIKAGRLAGHLTGRRVWTLALSDVPGDDPRIIGSGPLVHHRSADLALDIAPPAWLAALLDRAPPPPDANAFRAIETVLLATNNTAREAAAQAGRDLGLPVQPDPGLFEGEAAELGRAFARAVIEGPPGLYLRGGESTVHLPEDPGRGGRSQALALAAAIGIQSRSDISLLAAGTDGTDGPTDDAGALVDGGTVERGTFEGFDPDDCLRRADSGTFLEASGDLIQTGPTGTNVMDLVLALKD